MPAGLDTVLFTTSGTEANELAWRLATAWTGGEGAVIAEHAYHGSTRWMADLSSNEWPPGHRPARVGTFRAPIEPAGRADRRPRPHGGSRPPPSQLAGRAPRPWCWPTASSPARASGTRRRSSSPGWSTGAHAVGALFLADEVQSGFGRSGPQLWRFALAGVTPDIVTLGKPMGAGYPIGAVITRREIADRLAAVVRVLLDLRRHAGRRGRRTGRARRAGDRTSCPSRPSSSASTCGTGSRGLRRAHPALGEVRGYGLLAGVDLARPAGRAYAQDRARTAWSSTASWPDSPVRAETC